MFYSSVDPIIPKRNNRVREDLTIATALGASFLWESSCDEWKYSCHKRLTRICCTHILCLEWEKALSSQGFLTSSAVIGLYFGKSAKGICWTHTRAASLCANPSLRRPRKHYLVHACSAWGQHVLETCSYKTFKGRSSSIPTALCTELNFLGRLSLWENVPRLLAFWLLPGPIPTPWGVPWDSLS